MVALVRMYKGQIRISYIREPKLQTSQEEIDLRDRARRKRLLKIEFNNFKATRSWKFWFRGRYQWQKNLRKEVI